MEKIHLQQVLPADIEKRSFEIITEELLSRGKSGRHPAGKRAGGQTGHPHHRRF